MSGDTVLSLIFVGVTVLLALVVSFRVALTRATSGKILAFIALFILPAMAATQGFNEHMEKAKTTAFCLSCHVMHDYGRSLYVNDPSFIPAVHFQNHLVPTDQACFTCHTTYTMFGDYQAKFRGLRHLYVQYLGTVPKPENIKLYTPFNNRECLHCHLGMRKFEEAAPHHRTPGMMAQIKSNHLSCMSSNCHDTVHDLKDFNLVTFWKPTS
ncbi:MAG TPA: NapC/NirT family cytochrome c [Vicinamibacterales bacterium]|nr:NapC/NirT family cytochrome c [Vicinamibacterales bacterium]